jgi:hypothetical protein
LRIYLSFLRVRLWIFGDEEQVGREDMSDSAGEGDKRASLASCSSCVEASSACADKNRLHITRTRAMPR